MLTNKRRRNNVLQLFLPPILALMGLYLFSSSFFLAKRSLTQTSDCDEAELLLESYLDLSPLEIQQLQTLGLLLPSSSAYRDGCWMPRHADSVILLVVDALRFDFAQHRLPLSVGSRLAKLQQSKQKQRALAQQQQGNDTTKTTTTTTTATNLQQNQMIRSQLLQFVADPPTVTMQRLKGLTTGGLPTFADISANMGGAVVDEDSWIQQLYHMTLSSNGYYHKRGLLHPTRLGFVGDDTWVDLFPSQFYYRYPYPSFNTRDLDTVDNGCLQHLPTLLRKLRTKAQTTHDAENREHDVEVMVAHFLGVDHVGHTYGPDNIHMAEKLHQIDQTLSAVLDQMDQQRTPDDSTTTMSGSTCQVCFIFGDHGMTEDGNHGGGTENEVNAALFVHFSPGCAITTLTITQKQPFSSSSFDATGQETSSLLLTDVVGGYGETAYASIHQIDLVATISLLLGLPIPYANLGSLVPSLLPNMTAAHTATALALNAAQVWRYFSVYSKTAQRLPNLNELQQRLQEAVSVFQQALSTTTSSIKSFTVASDAAYMHLHFDSNLYHKAAALFKIFLLEATELGKRVWTRFDHVGMILGGAILFVGLALATWSLVGGNGGNVERQKNPVASAVPTAWTQPTLHSKSTELGLTVLFMTFHCVLLSFSNSYIETEKHVVIFMLAVLGIAIYLRQASIQSTTRDNINSTRPLSSRRLPEAVTLVIPVCARLGEVLVSGHGLDPSLQAHFAHNASVFLSSLVLLGLIRWQVQLNLAPSSNGTPHLWMDLATLLAIGASWWEKHLPDSNRNGFLSCRLAYLLLTAGLVMSILRLWRKDTHASANCRLADSTLTILFKLLLAIMAVTGPSTATSVVLFLLQSAAFWVLVQGNEVSTPVAAAIWRLIIRNMFFATNHACAFSRLQYSAAFVATVEFHFVMSGTALFLNTFGWEIVGNLMVMWMFSRYKTTNTTGSNRSNSYCDLWKWYGWYQLLETFCSCISVSLLRRHLMVWAVYAPRFLFAAIFLILNLTSQLLYAASPRGPMFDGCDHLVVTKA